MKKSKKKLEKQVQSILRSKMRVGESRHLAKLNDPNYKPFEKPLDTIHSFKTFDNYLQVSKEFIIYCQNTKGIDKYTHLSELSIYTKDYLKYREDNNYKMSTIKRDRAALGKLFGNSIDYPINAQKFIERSRNDVTRDKNYNAERNKDLISVALGTGLRRHELKRAIEKLDIMYLDKEERDIYENDLKALRIHKAEIKTAEEKGMRKGIEKGIQKGIQKGIEKGIEEGEKKKASEIAKNLLDVLGNETIAIKTGLTIEEIQQLR